jgi:hypothetical protein
MTATLQRLPDWPERLADYLAAMRQVPYSLGGNDCARFASGAVQAMTGRDVLPQQWGSAEQAADLLRRSRGLAAAVNRVLPALATPALAQRGDVLMVELAVHGGRARRYGLAIADGLRWWMPGPAGLGNGPMHLARCAWRV